MSNAGDGLAVTGNAFVFLLESTGELVAMSALLLEAESAVVDRPG